MATIKISNLPLIPSPSLSDIFPVVSGGVTYKQTIAQLQTELGFSSGILSLSSGGTSANLTATLGSLVYSTSSAMAFTSALTNGQLPIGSTGLAPVVANITSGTRINITNGPGSITISTAGGGLTWQVVTSNSSSTTVNNGYITNNASLVTLTLPVTANPGDIISIVGFGIGGWRLGQNSSQVIHFLSTDTTTGTSGHIDSTSRYDSVEILCLVANTEFSVIKSMGNISIT